MPQEHWAAYYRGGMLVSCPTNPEPGYAGRVRHAWADFFRHLGHGAAVLDVGTGNGPVALIAKQVSAEHDLALRICGVDLADIRPAEDVPDGARLFQGIEFQGGVSAEALPFGDGAFDAVVGQFIAEYTDYRRTLAEMSRVLAGQGLLQLILHHADSIVVQNATESLLHADLVNSEERLLDKTERYIEVAGQSGPAAETARQALIESGKRLEATAEASANPLLIRFVLQSVTSILEHRNQLSQSELINQVGRLQRELALWERRLLDLTGAALAPDGLQSFAAAAEASGFRDVDYRPLQQAGDILVGWLLQARRA